MRDAQQLVNTSLINSDVTEEQNAENANRQSNSSVRQSEWSVKMAATHRSDIELLQAEVKQLRGESTKL